MIKFLPICLIKFILLIIRLLIIQLSTIQWIASTGSAASHKAKHDEVFDPSKSTTTPETLDKFLKAPLTGNLTEIPGIGEVHSGVLMKATMPLQGCPDIHIRTSYQLFGAYLGCRQHGMTVKMHHDTFFNWLFEIGVHGQRNTIVDAIARRCSLMDPSLYNHDSYP